MRRIAALPPSLTAALEAYLRYRVTFAVASQKPRTAEQVSEYIGAVFTWIAVKRELTAMEVRAVEAVGAARLAALAA